MRVGIDLPFLPRFEEPIKSGRKTATTRTQPYGKPGDRLVTPFGVVRLIGVFPHSLGFVRNERWQEEGRVTVTDFEREVIEATGELLGIDPDALAEVAESRAKETGHDRESVIMALAEIVTA